MHACGSFAAARGGAVLTAGLQSGDVQACVCACVLGWRLRLVTHVAAADLRVCIAARCACVPGLFVCELVARWCAAEWARGCVWPNGVLCVARQGGRGDLGPIRQAGRSSVCMCHQLQDKKRGIRSRIPGNSCRAALPVGRRLLLLPVAAGGCTGRTRVCLACVFTAMLRLALLLHSEEELHAHQGGPSVCSSSDDIGFVAVWSCNMR
jgi:hypothetical protein